MDTTSTIVKQSTTSVKNTSNRISTTAKNSTFGTTTDVQQETSAITTSAQPVHTAANIVLSLGGIILIISLVSFRKIFKKAGRRGREVLLPFYNIYVITKIAKKPRYWFLLVYIPVFGLIWSLRLINGIVRRFGKHWTFTIGIMVLPILFLPILAFGSSTYHEDSPVQNDDWDILLGNTLMDRYRSLRSKTEKVLPTQVTSTMQTVAHTVDTAVQSADTVIDSALDSVAQGVNTAVQYAGEKITTAASQISDTIHHTSNPVPEQPPHSQGSPTSPTKS